jgi:nanoRNase/pAp phosphatase (c-di-AMP/oligoRNAs hydrolase)
MYTILGGGTVGYRLAKMLVDRGFQVTVVEKEPERVSWLRKMDIRVLEGDMKDIDLKDAGVTSAGAVMVVGDEGEANIEAIRRIRDVNGRVTIFARSSGDRLDEELKRAGADIVVHVPEIVSSAFVKETEDHELGRVAMELVAVLEDARPEGVAIFCHDNPDPDTLASGWALHHICEHRKVKAEIFFGGELALPGSKELVKRLRIPVKGLAGVDEVRGAIDDHSKIALVDSARPGENNCLPINVVPNIVIDHHSTSASARGSEFYEIRANVGATSTIMTKYYIQLGLPIDLRIATALFYGIKTDTANFTKNISPADLMAAAFLSSYVYQPLLDIFEAPPLPTSTIDAFGKAVVSRKVRGTASVSWLGELPDRSPLPLVVDFLMQEEGVLTAMVLALVDDTVQLSARNKDKEIHIGALLHRAFKGLGSAGGHATSAGGQIPFEALVDDIEAKGSESPEQVIGKVMDKVEAMIFDALGM